MEPLDPLQLLQEDLKDDDYEQAIACVKRIQTISLALGPERTRAELLPFLLSYCETDNDEAHTAIANQAGGMYDLVGGGEHVHCLFPILEKLAGEEECVVRDEAVKALNRLSAHGGNLATHFVPVVRRLANGDWFTNRVSASGVFATCYTKCDAESQQELRSIFQTLCSDDTPMVRKAAYKHLGAFATAVEPKYFKSDILVVLTKISQDDVDSMRVHAIAACTDLGKTLDPTEYGTHILPILEALQDDASWKVRKSLAEHLPTLFENLKGGDGENCKKLLPVFARLLKDKEAEVRTAGTKSLAPVCKSSIHSSTALMEHISPVLGNLASDQAVHVRAELSKAIGDLFIAFQKETAQRMLLTMLEQLAHDEAAEVRNNIIADIHKVTEVLGAASMGSTLLPILIELSKDQKWRVRMAVIEKASFIAQNLGLKKFEKQVQGIITTCLTDHVYSIREKCCSQIGLIVREFGGKWAAEKFFPEAFRIYDKNTNYLHRMTCLLIIMNSAPECSAEIIKEALLPIVLDAATDDVPNVRLAAAKALAEIIPKLDKSLVVSKIMPVLDTLMSKEDGDNDVAFFARAAQNVASARFDI